MWFHIAAYHAGRRLLFGVVEAENKINALDKFYDLYMEKWNIEQKTGCPWNMSDKDVIKFQEWQKRLDYDPKNWEEHFNNPIRPLLPEPPDDIKYSIITEDERKVQEQADKQRRLLEAEFNRGYDTAAAHRDWEADMKERNRLKWTDYALAFGAMILFGGGPGIGN
jgi:hypothetical protein